MMVLRLAASCAKEARATAASHVLLISSTSRASANSHGKEQLPPGPRTR